MFIIVAYMQRFDLVSFPNSIYYDRNNFGQCNTRYYILTLIYIPAGILKAGNTFLIFLISITK